MWDLKGERIMASVALKTQTAGATLGCWKGDSHQQKKSNQRLIDEFEDLYITYRSRVWALCLRMTGNPDDAEDLTQETFIRMFQKLSTFRGESAFCTWLRHIAINLVLQRFQKASWRHETPMEEVASSEPISGCPHKVEFGKADARLLKAIDRISLQRAINKLPRGFRSVLILHDIEGYEHVEISELMGCSVGTSKSQLHKARLRMRELLQQASLEEYEDYNHTHTKTANASDNENRLIFLFPHEVAQRRPAPVSKAA